MTTMTRRKLLRNLLALPTVASLPSCSSANRTRPQLPTSDHFDGERFFNPWGINNRKSFWDVLQWRLNGERCAWNREPTNSLRDYPPERVQGEQLRLSFVGHATVLIQTAGVNILLDPHWSERASPFSFAGPKRVNAPGINIADLPPIDWVLISHNHYDHLDLPTIGRLHAAQPRTRYLVPLNNAHLITEEYPQIEVHERDWQQSIELGEGVEAILQPAQHWSARGLRDRNLSLWAAFVIRTAHGNIYYAGDTGFGSGDHFRATAALHAPFRLSVLPVGAYAPRDFMKDQHMDPREAVLSAQLLQSQHNLGVHLRTFADLTDECYDGPEQQLSQALSTIQPDLQFKLLQAGESWKVPALA